MPPGSGCFFHPCTADSHQTADGVAIKWVNLALLCRPIRINLAELTCYGAILYSDSNGEMDWNTLGKILTAHILGEVGESINSSWINTILNLIILTVSRQNVSLAYVGSLSAIIHAVINLYVHVYVNIWGRLWLHDIAFPQISII